MQRKFKDLCHNCIAEISFHEMFQFYHDRERWQDLETIKQDYDSGTNIELDWMGRSTQIMGGSFRRGLNSEVITFTGGLTMLSVTSVKSDKRPFLNVKKWNRGKTALKCDEWRLKVVENGPPKWRLSVKLVSYLVCGCGYILNAFWINNLWV